MTTNLPPRLTRKMAVLQQTNPALYAELTKTETPTLPAHQEGTR